LRKDTPVWKKDCRCFHLKSYIPANIKTFQSLYEEDIVVFLSKQRFCKCSCQSLLHEFCKELFPTFLLRQRFKVYICESTWNNCESSKQFNNVKNICHRLKMAKTWIPFPNSDFVLNCALSYISPCILYQIHPPHPNLATPSPPLFPHLNWYLDECLIMKILVLKDECMVE